MNVIQQVCHYIEAHREEAVSLERLSQITGWSPGYLQRKFKDALGISPRQYLQKCRMDTLKHELRNGLNVTNAAVEAGFSSSSRLYEKLDTTLGMTPAQYSQRGKGLAISYASAAIAQGVLLLGATERGLCFIQLGQSKAELLAVLCTEFSQATLSPMPEASLPHFERWIQALGAYLAGQRKIPDLPLDIQGTAFQKKVWDYLQKIPHGAVASYTQVAEGIGQPKAARAVASACAANNLAFIIPCHRVLRGDGTLSGYRWGIPLKKALLEMERQAIPD